MSDETELNPQLREGEAAIEAALRGVALPDSAIDHDQVMYQSGWAAAMAEHGLAGHTATVQTKRSAGYWPALAMTFAATTAACLMVILLSPAESGSVAGSHVEPNRQAMVAETEDARQEDTNDFVHASPTKSKLTATNDIAAQRFGMAQLLGGYVEKVAADRNALFEKHLAEAASPSLDTFRTRSSRDFERRKPLTVRSVIPLSL